MTLYYFHLRNTHDRIIDDAGRELKSLEDVRRDAIQEARGIIAADARKGRIDLRQRIEVEDASGKIILSMPFREAVTIDAGPHVGN
jgi:hypothetical protein